MDSASAARARPAPPRGYDTGAASLGDDPPVSALRPARGAPIGEPSSAPRPPPTAAVDLEAFAAIYDEYMPFVWRSLRRLGVQTAGLDDAVQDVFLVVHRRLPEFEERSTVKTWLFGIVLRVARSCRRTVRRKSPEAASPVDAEDAEQIVDTQGAQPDELAEKTEAMRVLHAILDELDDEKREVFVLAELEQMTAPEISEVLGVNLNSVYSRLRAARRDFDQSVARRRARDGWRYR